MNRASRPRVPRAAKEFGAVSFLNDLASEMVYPLLPALVTGLGGGAAALGTLDGVAEAVSSGIKLSSGWLADRLWLRRPLVIVGYLLATVSRPIMGLATATWQVVSLRASDRVGKALRTPPRDAIIADAAHPLVRARSFALHRALDHAGAVVGPVLAWALLTYGMRTPDVITSSIIPGFLAVVLVVWATRRLPKRASGPPHVDAPPSGPDAPEGAARPLFGLIIAFAFVRMPETLFLLRLQGVGVAVRYVPLAWAALHVVRSSASYSGGWMSDRWGKRPTMLVGWGIYGVATAGLATAGSAGVALVWFLVFGLVAALTESPERALVAGAARVGRRGRGYGLYHAAVGLATLPGSIVLGVLYEQFGAPRVLFGSAAAAGLLVLAGIMVRNR